MNVIRNLKALLEDILREQEDHKNMVVGWADGEGDPGCDPSMQYELEQKIEEMTKNFFKISTQVSHLFNGTNLSGYVIVYDDGSYEAQKHENASGFQALLLSEARLFKTQEEAEAHAEHLDGVARVVYARDLVIPTEWQ